MNKKLPFLLAGGLTLALALCASEAPVSPASAPAAPAAAPAAKADPAAEANFNTQLRDIIGKINAKLQKGLRDESDFASDLADFNALIAAHKGEKSESVATAEYMKDLLYFQFFKEPEKGLAGYKRIVQDYPDTGIAKQIAQLLPQLEPQVSAMAASIAAQKNLAVGKTFPEFAVAAGDVKDLAGNKLSVAQYRGKVVLVDFWATWCGPCMAEMPNVIAAYEKYHSKGFDIIGVSLDHEEARATLPKFLADNHMPWRQYFDGKFWQNELAVKYGVEAIPANYLLDAEGKIIGSSLR
ncbi:MAG TPA: TlpA disulfide reductase family protein, partial [Opitutales bacterium]|nr:TlpA disulfide reductase family protein [Opitutales bacterium]